MHVSANAKLCSIRHRQRSSGRIWTEVKMVLTRSQSKRPQHVGTNTSFSDQDVKSVDANALVPTLSVTGNLSSVFK